jgi:hypothetical protein
MTRWVLGNRFCRVPHPAVFRVRIFSSPTSSCTCQLPTQIPVIPTEATRLFSRALPSARRVAQWRNLSWISQWVPHMPFSHVGSWVLFVRARLQPCRKTPKQKGASAPEVCSISAAASTARARYSNHYNPRHNPDMVRTILLIVLVLLLLGALPAWPYSAGWGYYPSGGLGLLLLIVIILVVAKKI